MKIAVDLRCLGGEGHAKRGIGKYLYGMLPELFRLAAEDEFILYVWRGTNLGDELTSFNNVSVRPVGNRIIQKADNFYALRRTRHFPLNSFAKISADIFFLPDIFYGLYPKLPTVAVLYDVIPLLYERQYFTFHLDDGTDFFGWKVRDRYRMCIERFASIQHIISISQASLNDLHRLAPATEAVPHTITHLAAQALPVSHQKTKSGRYLLYVGGNDYRKNITELIGDFEKLVAQPKFADVKLVLVGNDFKESARAINKPFWKRLDDSTARSAIELRGYVETKELARLYGGAEIFVFPSQYEGFGLPVIEAMAAGLPVVAHNNSSITEIADGAAFLAKTPSDFTKGLEKLLADAQLRKKYIARGKARAKQFTWQKTAEGTLKALRAADKI